MSPVSQATDPALKFPYPLLAALIAATVLSYWIGLHGPFLLDDHPNLAPVKAWLAGQNPLDDLLWSKVASPYGRPLAMASFAANAALGGFVPFSFKAGNLLVHVLCGLLAFVLVRRIANRDPMLAPHGQTVALLVAGIWLLHPLNASTVLYAVQRMAQLSTLWMLFGMWAYMVLRTRMQRAPGVGTMAMLVLAVATATLLGVMSKENALVLPALCLVLELGCFRGEFRPRRISAFFGLSVFLPVLVGLLAFAHQPGRLLGGYVGRSFTLTERLLTQARVLCDYLWMIVAPNPSRMGVYTDDVTLSTGLLSPPTTLLAILILLGITMAVWCLRQRVSALFIGWGIFLVGHAIESTIIPLELYFEHRNYLPMFGVLYALVGLAVWIGRRLKSHGMQVERLGVVLSLGILIVLGVGTHARARVWGNEALLVESAVAAHPDSMRAQLAVVDAAIRMNNLPRANAALTAMTQSANTKTRAQGHLNRINLACAVAHVADPRDLAAAARNAPPRISKDEAEMFALLLDNTKTPCKGISDSALAEAAATFAQRAQAQPDWFGPKAELRHIAASFHARQGDWTEARPLAQLAWQPGMPIAASVVVINSQLATGDLVAAERTYGEALARVDPANAQDAAGLRWLRKRIDAARQTPVTAPSRAQAPQ